MFDWFCFAAAGLGLVYAWHRGMKMQRALDAPEPSDRCVACDSTNVRLIAKEAYRCRECDFEGGPGLAEMKRAKRIEAARALDPATRRRRAFEELEAARVLLEGALITLDEALSLSRQDLLGMDDHRGKQHEAGNAMSRIIEAQHHLRLANELDGSVAGEELTRELSFDAGILNDFPVFELAFHSRLKELDREAKALLTRVERALASMSHPTA